MARKDEIIDVGNPEKGYALYNRTQGEYITGFDYTNIIIKPYGVCFLFKGEDCEIVNFEGKKLSFDSKYFWQALSSTPLGIGAIYGTNNKKLYIANYRGEIISGPYERARCGCLVPTKISDAIYTGKVFLVGRKKSPSEPLLIGLISFDGEVIVPCEHENLSIMYENIFELCNLVEKYGIGLIPYASDDILSSRTCMLKLIESAIKNIKYCPKSVNQDAYLNFMLANMFEDLKYMFLGLSHERNFSIKREGEMNAYVTSEKYSKLLDEETNDGEGLNRIEYNYYKKSLERLIDFVVSGRLFI